MGGEWCIMGGAIHRRFDKEQYFYTRIELHEK